MNPRPGMDLRRASVLTCLLITATARSAPPTDTQPATNDLACLVRDYFLQDDSAERRELRMKIEGLEGVTVAQVAEAVRQVQVWEPRSAGRGDFAFVTASGEKRAVQVRIPEAYDPANRYPLIMGFGAAAGDDVDDCLDSLLALIGPGRDEFIIAAPVRYDGALFDVKPVEALEPVDLLHELRRRYRVDSDRVYIVGTARDDGAALNLGVFYTHWLAGAVVLNDTLCVPYPRQSYEFLLPNLAHTPTLLVWASDSHGHDTTQPARVDSVAASNQLIRELAERIRLPIQSIELRPGTRAGPTQLLDRVADVLQSRRDPDPRVVSHWFRYPVQGRMGWLRQLAFDGRPWEASCVTIVASPSTDFHAYATKVLQGKLAYIGGRIEGQHIAISTANTTDVELRLCEHLVDLNQPIQIDWNGRKQFSARVEPRISTLLELAYEEWEFQHAVPVRLVIGEQGPPRQR